MLAWLREQVRRWQFNRSNVPFTFTSDYTPTPQNRADAAIAARHIADRIDEMAARRVMEELSR